jgi:hypothetical protein
MSDWDVVMVRCSPARLMAEEMHPVEDPFQQAAWVEQRLQAHFPDGPASAFIAHQSYVEHNRGIQWAEMTGEQVPEENQDVRRWATFARDIRNVEIAHERVGLRPAKFNPEKGVDFVLERARQQVVAQRQEWRIEDRER